jgi:hypothetical protein
MHGDFLDLKKYFDKELNSTVIHSLAGFAAGYASFVTNNPPLAIVIMLVVLGITHFLVKFLLKINEDKKWWLGNGLIVYIFFWFVVWTMFYNVGIA